MYRNQSPPHFLDLSNEVILTRLLDELQASARAKWGSMTPQQMLEHLAESIEASNGKRTDTLDPSVTPEKAAYRKSKMVLTDFVIPHGVQIPDSGEFPRFADLESAKAALLTALREFHAFFEDPSTTAMHPSFGPMNYLEWKTWHSKHLSHHFKQFGLWEIAYTMREATPADAEALSSMIEQNALVTLGPHYSPLQMKTFLTYYSPEVIREKFLRQAIFCAVEGDKIIGTIALDGEFVVGFYTHVDYLGQGVGSWMMRHIEKYALAQGLTAVQLTASPAGAAFYYKKGFEKVRDYVFSYLDVDFDETLMVKQLGR